MQANKQTNNTDSQTNNTKYKQTQHKAKTEPNTASKAQQQQSN